MALRFSQEYRECGLRNERTDLLHPIGKLVQACKNNNTEEVTLLLALGLDPNGFIHTHPLTIAVRKGNTEMIRALLEYGAHPDMAEIREFSKEFDYSTIIAYSPLYAAITKNKMTALYLLLEAGADPNLQHEHGFMDKHKTPSALEVAQRLGNFNALALMQTFLKERILFQP